MKKMRVIAFVDGMNLYNGINDFNRYDINAEPLKWLDLHKLLNFFIDPATQELAEIRYYSSKYIINEKSSTEDKERRDRQETYISALEATGVGVFLGHYKIKWRRCPQCKKVHPVPEEKETDVRIATDMTAAAYAKSCGKIVLVSGDTDMVPAIKHIKTAFPKLRLNILFPPYRSNRAFNKISNQRKNLELQHLQKSLLPTEIKRKKGRPLTRPAKYH